MLRNLFGMLTTPEDVR